MAAALGSRAPSWAGVPAARPRLAARILWRPAIARPSPGCAPSRRAAASSSDAAEPSPPHPLSAIPAAAAQPAAQPADVGSRSADAGWRRDRKPLFFLLGCVPIFLYMAVWNFQHGWVGGALMYFHAALLILVSLIFLTFLRRH